MEPTPNQEFAPTAPLADADQLQGLTHVALVAQLRAAGGPAAEALVREVADRLDNSTSLQLAYEQLQAQQAAPLADAGLAKIAEQYTQFRDLAALPLSVLLDGAIELVDTRTVSIATCGAGVRDEARAKFLADAVNVLPGLLARVAAAEARADELEAREPSEALGQLMATHALELMDVFRERQRQLRKFGPQNRTPQEWFLIFAEEVGEVAKECVELQFDDAAHPLANPANYYKEMVESVAVGLAALQNFNQRRGFTPTANAGKEPGQC